MLSTTPTSLAIAAASLQSSSHDRPQPLHPAPGKDEKKVKEKKNTSVT